MVESPQVKIGTESSHGKGRGKVLNCLFFLVVPLAWLASPACGRQAGLNTKEFSAT